MAPYDVWPDNVRKHEQWSGEQDDAQLAGLREDGAAESNPGQSAYDDGRGSRNGRGTVRFLYPVAVITGILLLIILAAV